MSYQANETRECWNSLAALYFIVNFYRFFVWVVEEERYIHTCWKHTLTWS